MARIAISAGYARDANNMIVSSSMSPHFLIDCVRVIFASYTLIDGILLDMI